MDTRKIILHYTVQEEDHANFNAKVLLFTCYGSSKTRPTFHNPIYVHSFTLPEQAPKSLLRDPPEHALKSLHNYSSSKICPSHHSHNCSSSQTCPTHAPYTQSRTCPTHYMYSSSGVSKTQGRSIYMYM